MIRARHAAAAWWRELQPDPENGGGDRATLAQLRRCATVGELMLEPASIILFRRCEAETFHDLPRIALAAGVLAHVRTDDKSMHPARRVGPDAPEKPETALLKPLRFRWLMEADSPDDRLAAFRRLSVIAGRELNISALTDALLDWTEDRQRRWVFAYWNADPPLTPTPPVKETAA
jgi:CRISPR system Cascade subunit CasB